MTTGVADSTGVPVVKPRLLVVEDDDDMREQMRWAMAAHYEVYEAADRNSAIAMQQKVRAPLVTLDLGLPPDTDGVSQGYEVLEALLRMDPTTKVIVITGKSDRVSAVGAVERGAFDYLTKPVELEELRVIMRRALHLGRLEQDLQPTPPHQAFQQSFHGMLGSTVPMQRLFSLVTQVADSAAPVLILGESGTGKELVARAIHHQGARRSGPFVAINCAALPESLLESELFGYEKGAFTGANSTRPGHLEMASGGTLFLDELGEIPLPLQVKLLRFLQEYVVTRVGGRDEIKVNTRVVAATNVDIRRAIQDGEFREDLYYRLAIVTLQLPALRERPDDILPLAEAFLQRDLVAEGKPVKKFSPGARSALSRYTWPGNVRQLENHVRRSALMSLGSQITEDDLQLPDVQGAANAPVGATTLRAAREALERNLAQETLDRFDGNVSRAAKALGVSRPTLHELINKYQLKK